MQDHLSTTFAALADPTRRAILARLALGETNVSELAEPFAMSMPAVSKHLKVLERAGLIARGREAQWRPCRLNASPLKEAAGWIEEYRRFWTPYIDALERHLDRMKLAESTRKASATTRRKAAKPKRTGIRKRKTRSKRS
ncbi:MAG TPA: metalloregulator ArsR/SmtB family transcription factor [Terracidiphilus sp.]|jgi:DNA-binding transcriptional ArsR family regulator|nr:metalloregulator ArsR/SmtB family transcription factor [Terracidiphilus sp.]